MPKRMVDPTTGAVVFKSTPEEQAQAKLRKRVRTLEQKVEELESIIKQLLEVKTNE